MSTTGPREPQDGQEALSPKQLLELVYAELHALAAHHLRGERIDHTLQPTALVHEAWMRLSGKESAVWQDRGHFLGVASLGMRRVLVDHARARLRDKRGGGDTPERLWTNIPENEGGFGRPLDLLALDQALEELAVKNERAAKVVELRFFGGLSEEDTALAMGVSRSTVTLDWRSARAWLGVRLEALECDDRG